VLEKVAADYADRGVLLVKIDVDKDKLIAAQFRVQSIPTVYALFQGQLVADLTNARTESQLTRLLDQIIAKLPIESSDAAQAQDIAGFIAMGEEMLAEGDAERAAGIFAQVAEMAPGDAAALSGQARALIAAGRPEEAAAILDAVPPDKAGDPAISRARAALALAGDAAPAEEIDTLARTVAADPDDHDARFKLAGALMSAGDRDGAADALLEIIARDRAWNEGAARAQLLKLFEVVGLEDPWVSAQRRRLSALLFT
jgi:putative thioredoxin